MGNEPKLFSLPHLNLRHLPAAFLEWSWFQEEFQVPSLGTGLQNSWGKTKPKPPKTEQEASQTDNAKALCWIKQLEREKTKSAWKETWKNCNKEEREEGDRLCVGYLGWCLPGVTPRAGKPQQSRSGVLCWTPQQGQGEGWLKNRARV